MVLKCEKICENTLFFILFSAFGAFLRFGSIEGFMLLGQDFALTWGVFIINVMGCAFFGAGWVYTQDKEFLARLILVAFLGSFTTFSTYIYDIYFFMEQEQYVLLLSNTFLQLVLGIVFLRLGMYIMKRFQQNKYRKRT